MIYYLSEDAVLKWLEGYFLYNTKKDELYELDEESFDFLKDCINGKSCSNTSQSPQKISRFFEEPEFVRYCINEGILSASPRKKGHPPIIRSPIPSLRYLELQITNRCNLLCKHCYIEDRDHVELSINNIVAVLKEFEEMQGLRVMITGGEPLLHTGFQELNEILQLFSVRKVLLTNGLLINKRLIKRLNFQEVQISIDGIDVSHDVIRGKGTFKRAMESIRLLKESGIDVSVATVVHRGNLGDLERLGDLLSSMKIKTWTVDIPCIVGRLRSNEDFALSPDEGGKYLRHGFGDDLHSSSPGFGCGAHLMAVTARGEIAKCTFYSNRKVGTIKEGLRNCWEKIRPVRLEELECDCDFLEVCRGGCRYRAELLTGNPSGKDLYRCSFYQNMEKGHPKNL